MCGGQKHEHPGLEGRGAVPNLAGCRALQIVTSATHGKEAGGTSAITVLHGLVKYARLFSSQVLDYGIRLEKFDCRVPAFVRLDPGGHPFYVEDAGVGMGGCTKAAGPCE